VFQLIITVMSIALAAGAAMTTLSYLNPTLPLQQQTQQRIEVGFEAFHKAWSDYSEANKTYAWLCDTYTTTEGTYEDCWREVSNFGYLPAANWQSLLIPEHTMMPRSPEGMTWSYGEEPPGWYFCADGAVNEAQLKGIYRAETNFPVNSYFVSTTCGDTASIAIESMDPSLVKATYWVKRN